MSWPFRSETSSAWNLRSVLPSTVPIRQKSNTHGPSRPDTCSGCALPFQCQQLTTINTNLFANAPKWWHTFVQQRNALIVLSLQHGLRRFIALVNASTLPMIPLPESHLQKVVLVPLVVPPHPPQVLGFLILRFLSWNALGRRNKSSQYSDYRFDLLNGSRRTIQYQSAYYETDLKG